MSGPTPSTPLLPRLSGSFGGPRFLWRAGALLGGVYTSLWQRWSFDVAFHFFSCISVVLVPRWPGAAAVGVLTGAFGAHGLRNRPGITPQKIHAWETAAHYAIFNGIALLVISQHSRFGVHKFAGPAVGIGAVLFSGSIFLLTFTRDRMKWLGPVTPLGGSILIAGYLALAL